MPTLALAGGISSSIGRAIVTALLSAPHGAKWKTVILSRSSRPPLWLRAVDPHGSRAQLRVVDYLSPSSLEPALRGVDTLISVTSAIDGNQAQIQINLLRAAVKAGCRRFAPSQWGMGPTGWEAIAATRWSVEGVWEQFMKFENEIQCARFNSGSFMNYLGHGIYPVPEAEADEDTQLQKLQAGGGYVAGEDEACQGLLRQGDLTDSSSAILIALKNGIAELPQRDDGQWPRITMTMMRDVGRFVVAALELPRWEHDMNMVGETLTMGELLAHAESVTGKKLDVAVVKREGLEEQLTSMAPDDFLGSMWAEFKLAYCRDQPDEVYLEPVVNRLCPEVKPTSVREYLERYWKGV